MLAAGSQKNLRSRTVELPRLLGSGIAASAAGHLSILAVILLFAEVHPFGPVTAEPIAVDIVSPDEAAPAAKEEEPLPQLKAQPSDAFDLLSKAAASGSPVPAAAQDAAARPQKQAALSTPRPTSRQATA